MLNYIKTEICQPYCERFMSQQFSDLKQMLENEDFQRLPLPKDFDLSKELTEMLKVYPEREKSQKYLEVYKEGCNNSDA